jgi:uncharacterized protein (TIGR00251 family)
MGAVSFLIHMLIKVTVFPESSADYIEMVSSDTYRVYVRASAQRGHANKEVLFLLGNKFGKRVKLVSGGMRTHKIVEVL